MRKKTTRWSNFKASRRRRFCDRKNMWNKENCHDKCLMSLALALWKQNKSVTCEERRWKLLEINKRKKLKWWEKYSKQIFQTLQRYSENHHDQKVECNNKRWESFLWFIHLQRAVDLKSREKNREIFLWIVGRSVAGGSFHFIFAILEQRRRWKVTFKGIFNVSYSLKLFCLSKYSQVSVKSLSGILQKVNKSLKD